MLRLYASFLGGWADPPPPGLPTGGVLHAGRVWAEPPPPPEIYGILQDTVNKRAVRILLNGILAS